MNVVTYSHSKYKFILIGKGPDWFDSDIMIVTLKSPRSTIQTCIIDYIINP